MIIICRSRPLALGIMRDCDSRCRRTWARSQLFPPPQNRRQSTGIDDGPRRWRRRRRAPPPAPSRAGAARPRPRGSGGGVRVGGPRRARGAPPSPSHAPAPLPAGGPGRGASAARPRPWPGPWPRRRAAASGRSRRGGGDGRVGDVPRVRVGGLCREDKPLSGAGQARLDPRGALKERKDGEKSSGHSEGAGPGGRRRNARAERTRLGPTEKKKSQREPPEKANPPK